MAESGCLRSEKLNTLDVSKKIVAEKFNGHTIHVQSGDNFTFAGFNESSDDGDQLVLVEDVDIAAKGGGNALTFSIDWPTKTYVSELYLMFTDKDSDDPSPLNLIPVCPTFPSAGTQASDNISVSFTVGGAGAAELTNTGIMRDKILLASDDPASPNNPNLEVYKNVPIQLINYSTGILEHSIHRKCSAIKRALQPNVVNDPFNIINAEDNTGDGNDNATKSWTYDAESSGGSSSYPLYNKETTNLKFNINIKRTDDGSSANFPNTPDFTKLNLKAICTFMKNDLSELG